MKKLILSPFLIVFGILEIFLFFMAIYYLLIDSNGGKALGGSIFFIGFIIFFFALAIEQLILKNIKLNRNKVWISETIILILLTLYLYFNGISIG